MTKFFEELFEYNYSVNESLSEVFNDGSLNSTEKSLKLFNHILNSHQIWNNRIYPLNERFDVWGIHPVEELQTINKANYEHTLKILDKSDLNELINYSTTKGQVYTNSVRDILFHVINHSTYHRGQIAVEFRQNGIQPLSTDYIIYKRQI